MLFFSAIRVSASRYCLDHLKVFAHLTVPTQVARHSTFVILFSVLGLSAISSTVVAESKLAYRMRPPLPQLQTPTQSSTFATSTYNNVTVPAHMTRSSRYLPRRPGAHYRYQAPYVADDAQYQGIQLSPIDLHAPQAAIENDSQQRYGYTQPQLYNRATGSTTGQYNELPRPAEGMYWQYENGRYLQVPEPVQ